VRQVRLIVGRGLRGLNETLHQPIFCHACRCCFHYRHERGLYCQEGAKPAAPLPSVTVARAVTKDIRPSVSFSARVEAIDKVELRARVDGFLEKRLFTEGQDVKAGDLLFVMEKGQYEAAVGQVEGAIESAQSALELANIDVDRQTALVDKSAAPKSQRRPNKRRLREASPSFRLRWKRQIWTSAIPISVRRSMDGSAVHSIPSETSSGLRATSLRRSLARIRSTSPFPFRSARPLRSARN
jgi:multidrug efflux pump subunit AcrA (membrane-fusion protein)